jgi:hypothetical protein
MGTVTSAVVRFRSGVPNLHFLKYPNILVADMNFLQAAMYKILRFIESPLIMLASKCWK